MMALREFKSGEFKSMEYSEEELEEDQGTNNIHDNKKKSPLVSFPSSSRVHDGLELCDYVPNNIKKKKPLVSFSSPPRVRDWSELPRDISYLIGDKMRFFPHLQKFGAASKEWNSITCEITETHATKKQSELLPMLMLPYNQETQTATFFDVKNSKTYDLKMPELKNQSICGVCNAWLAMVDDNLDISLFNTVTRALIKLPPLPPCGIANISHKIRRVALSCDPSSSDCFIAVIFAKSRGLAVCRLGDNDWSMEVNQRRQDYMGILFYQGKLFAFMEFLCILVFEYHKKGDLRMLKEIQLPYLNSDEWPSLTRYFVESSEDLFHVRSVGLSEKTWGFEVYRFEPTSEEKIPWNKVYSLGDRSLFYGYHTCICMSVKEFPWCKPNCIYFINERGLFTAYGYYWENGVYSLEENRVIARFDIQHPVPFLSAPSIWYRPMVL